MNDSQQPHFIWSALNIANQFKFLILGCVTFCTLGGVIYALSSPKVYQASQPFLVRDEISGQIMKPGRFESLEAMKSAQETIQQITKNPDVLRNALKAVGPTSWFADPENYPSFEDIESFRDNVWISAANGSELGKTEVIQLNVRSTSRERAYKLIESIADGVRQQLRDVRSRRASSIEAELNATRMIARQHLEEVTERVVKMEIDLGQDLSELQSMENPNSSEGSLRASLVKVQTELLTSQTVLDEVQLQVDYFENTLANPQNLAAVPSDLLQQSPALNALKLGMIQAQLDLAKTAARFNEASSEYQQAKAHIENIAVQIQREIQSSVAAASAQKKLIQGRILSLHQQQEGLKQRMQRLASRRAPYANLMAEQSAAAEQYRVAQKEYAEAVALQKGSEQTDLLTQLEQPEVGSQPVSASRSSVVLASAGGGVFLSLGLVMLLSSPGTQVSPEQLERLARQRDEMI